MRDTVRRVTAVLVLGIALLTALPMPGAHASAMPALRLDVAASPENELLATYAPVIVVALVGLVIIMPLTSVVYVAVAAAVRDLSADTATASWSRALTNVRHHPRGVVAELLTRAFTNTLLFTVVLSPVAVWLLARWCVVAATGLESPHPLRRSTSLTRGHRVRTGALAGLVTTLSIAIPGLSATLLLLLTGWSFLFVNVVTSLVAAVVIPVTAATMALLHGDLRAADPVTPDTNSIV